ncbi:MAG: flagellar hook-associated protein FlgL [Planctomycetota bacterium]|jgi:flagellar hook-associated protein 3 FlgL
MAYSLDAIFKNSSWAIAKNSSALASLQQKAATGQDINRISDDPTDSNQIMGLLNDSRSKEQYIKTLDEVISILDLGSSVIQSLTEELGQARAQLTSAMSGATSGQLRGTLAADLDNTLEQLVSLVNTQRLGQNVVPYTVERNDQGEITRVIYQGSYEEQKVQVSSGLDMSAMLVGDDFFRVDDRGELEFFGDTGAAAGTGTSSVRGDTILEVTGVPGNWQLSIDGGATSVTVNGTETNVPVIHSETGEIIYLDATGITEAGTEPIRAPGTYDMFNILINARDMLKNTDNLKETQVVEMMSESIASVQNAQQKLVNAFPIVGGRVQTLTNLRDSIQDMKLNTDEEISLLRDTDVTQVAIDLARYEVLYEMSLNVAAKMFSMSLLDFLR